MVIDTNILLDLIAARVIYPAQFKSESQFRLRLSDLIMQCQKYDGR